MVVNNDVLALLEQKKYSSAIEAVKQLELTDLKNQYFDAIYASKALLIKDKEFDLKSGGKSHVYLSHNHFLSRIEHVRLLARIYACLLEFKKTPYKLAIVDSVMSPVIATALSVLTNKDLVIITASKTEHGLKTDVFGDLTGEIVLIDDLTTTGNSIVEAAKKIREKGGAVTHAVVSTCRNGSAKENLKQNGIELLHLATLKEVIRELYDKITPEEKQTVFKELGLEYNLIS